MNGIHAIIINKGEAEINNTPKVMDPEIKNSEEAFNTFFSIWNQQLDELGQGFKEVSTESLVEAEDGNYPHPLPDDPFQPREEEPSFIEEKTDSEELTTPGTVQVDDTKFQFQEVDIKNSEEEKSQPDRESFEEIATPPTPLCEPDVSNSVNSQEDLEKSLDRQLDFLHWLLKVPFNDDETQQAAFQWLFSQDTSKMEEILAEIEKSSSFDSTLKSIYLLHNPADSKSTEARKSVFPDTDHEDSFETAIKKVIDEMSNEPQKVVYPMNDHDDSFETSIKRVMQELSGVFDLSQEKTENKGSNSLTMAMHIQIGNDHAEPSIADQALVKSSFVFHQPMAGWLHLDQWQDKDTSEKSAEKQYIPPIPPSPRDWRDWDKDTSEDKSEEAQPWPVNANWD